MQQVFLVSDADSLNALNELLKEEEEWFVSEISHPNSKGGWLVVLDQETEEIDEF